MSDVEPSKKKTKISDIKDFLGVDCISIPEFRKKYKDNLGEYKVGSPLTDGDLFQSLKAVSVYYNYKELSVFDDPLSHSSNPENSPSKSGSNAGADISAHAKQASPSYTALFYACALFFDPEIQPSSLPQFFLNLLPDIEQNYKDLNLDKYHLTKADPDPKNRILYVPNVTEKELAFQKYLHDFFKPPENLNKTFKVAAGKDSSKTSNSDLYVQYKQGGKLIFESVIEVKLFAFSPREFKLSKVDLKHMNELIAYSYRHHTGVPNGDEINSKIKEFKNVVGFHLLWYFDCIFLLGTVTEKGDSQLTYCIVAKAEIPLEYNEGTVRGVNLDDEKFQPVMKLLRTYWCGLDWIARNYYSGDGSSCFERYPRSVSLGHNTLLFDTTITTATTAAAATTTTTTTTSTVAAAAAPPLLPTPTPTSAASTSTASTSTASTSAPVTPANLGSLDEDQYVIAKFFDQKEREASDRRPNKELHTDILVRKAETFALYQNTEEGVVLFTEYFRGRMFPRTMKQIQKVYGQLDALHTKGWIHGDVRIENIVFSEEDDGAWLIDFDLARQETETDKPCYSPTYNFNIAERSQHEIFKNLTANQRISGKIQMDKEHDLYALMSIVDMFFTGYNPIDDVDDAYRSFFTDINGLAQKALPLHRLYDPSKNKLYCKYLHDATHSPQPHKILEEKSSSPTR